MIPIKVKISPLKSEPEVSSEGPSFDGTYLMVGTISSVSGEPCAVVIPLDDASGEETSVALCSITAHSITPLKSSLPAASNEELPVGEMSLKEYIVAKEKEFIQHALIVYGGREKAAAALKISIATLYRKLGQVPPQNGVD